MFQFKDEEACQAGLGGWTRDERDKLSQVILGWYFWNCNTDFFVKNLRKKYKMVFVLKSLKTWYALIECWRIFQLHLLSLFASGIIVCICCCHDFCYHSLPSL